ncbi:MAG: C40 family peptidase [Pedobacter sp.]|nr:C40 family peptidase [Pedobacter sp.]MDQ8053358.1 C40 family peptidase [Pedobacter sp.]
MESYHVCRIAIAPLRKEPSDRSEITSQLLFGDRAKVLEKTEKWCYVQSQHDQYEGWMDYKQLEKISSQQYADDQGFVYRSPLQLDNTLIGENGTKYYLSPGSRLPYYDDGFCFLGEKKYEVTFKPFVPELATFGSKVEETAKFFENTPYLWGGRTLFGIDCSGFVQMVYSLNGIQLRRDASQQAEQGELVDFLAAAKLGDLAFFDNDEGKIIHVGLMLGNDKIIHSAGMVRIDPIDNQGIYNAELGKYTHQLRIIKRFV